jgi:hypothetical protein
MIKFFGEWIGITDIAKEEFKELHPRAEKAVYKAGLYFEGRIKAKLSGPRSGRIYSRHGIIHQASAPGEPPASDTGKYRQSVTTTPPEWNGDDVACAVGTDRPQARILEYGGIAGNGARILPRPLWEQTFAEERDTLETIMAEVVQS